MAGGVSAEVLLDRAGGGILPHVCCRELQGCIPLTHDAEACRQMFNPWTEACEAHLVGGQFCIKVPLKRLVAAGHGGRVLAAMRRLPDWMLRTLEWPHSVFSFLIAGDRSGALNHLRRGSCGGDPGRRPSRRKSRPRAAKRRESTRRHCSRTTVWAGNTCKRP